MKLCIPNQVKDILSKDPQGNVIISTKMKDLAIAVDNMKLFAEFEGVSQ